MFLCPSDSIVDVGHVNDPGIERLLPSAVGAQPGFLLEADLDLFFAVPTSEFDLKPAPTNYLGCAGAYSGGEIPENIPNTMKSMKNYKGVFRSRQSASHHQIRDGTSNTILLGESIGYINNRNRSAPQSWFFGGLFRGHSNLEWESELTPGMPGLELFGDSWYAYPVGLGSMHPGHVNIGRADGSVMALSRAMDWQTLYLLCGMNDGMVPPSLD
jgi:hypothetical protein